MLRVAAGSARSLATSLRFGVPAPASRIPPRNCRLRSLAKSGISQDTSGSTLCTRIGGCGRSSEVLGGSCRGLTCASARISDRNSCFRIQAYRAARVHSHKTCSDVLGAASRKSFCTTLVSDSLRCTSGDRAVLLQAMASTDDVITGQFSAVEAHLEDLNSVRERIGEVVRRLDGTMRTMHSALLTIHGVGSDAVNLALEKCREKIPELQREYQELTKIMQDRPREYYRFNDQWRSQSSTVSFLLCFIHWLETGALLSHEQVEAQLNLDRSKFGIDIEDYLIGVCNLSSELPRFVINRVTIGDYECPRRVACFLNDLFAAFRKLNLRNDLLRRKFDGLKYDLKKVEEVLYDVEIRGLGNKDTSMT